MSDKVFEWSDELVTEYIRELLVGELGLKSNHMEQFKKSKQPKEDKEWEILECKGADGDIHWYNHKLCLGADRWVPKCTIHSVKRLSDGEVFTVGDFVFGDSRILDFHLFNNDLVVTTQHLKMSGNQVTGSTLSISELKKRKQP